MKNVNQPINITITSGTIIKTVFILIALVFAFIIKDLLLALLTSVIIASAVEPGTRWFIKRKVPRVLSVLIIYIVAATLFIVLLIPMLGYLTKFVDNLPGYVNTITAGAEQLEIPISVKEYISDISSSFNNINFLSSAGSSISGVTTSVFATGKVIFGGALTFVLIIVLSFYLAVQENGVANFLRIITPIQHEKYVLDLWKRSQRKIGLWMQGQLVLGIMIGVLTFLGLAVIGINIEDAVFLAVVAALFELIPLFGPILAAVPAAIIGFAQQDGLTLGFLVIGLYIIIQQFESQLIHPLVVKKIVGIPAIIAIVALIVGAQLAGFVGILISVPIAAVLMEYLGDVEKRKAEQLKELS